MRRLVIGSGRTLLVALGALSLGGCFAVAAGAAAGYGAVQHARNDDVRVYPADFAVVWPAALAAMNDAGFPVGSAPAPSATHGEIEVNDAELEVKQVGPGRTQVRVEIGTFTTEAHRRVSADIHAGIARRVGAP
jgi:hypothetical protein